MPAGMAANTHQHPRPGILLHTFVLRFAYLGDLMKAIALGPGRQEKRKHLNICGCSILDP